MFLVLFVSFAAAQVSDVEPILLSGPTADTPDVGEGAPPAGKSPAPTDGAEPAGNNGEHTTDTDETDEPGVGEDGSDTYTNYVTNRLGFSLVTSSDTGLVTNDGITGKSTNIDFAYSSASVTPGISRDRISLFKAHTGTAGNAADVVKPRSCADSSTTPVGRSISPGSRVTIGSTHWQDVVTVQMPSYARNGTIRFTNYGGRALESGKHCFFVGYRQNSGAATTVSTHSTPLEIEVKPHYDYDTDNDNLIEITTLAQLNAMRWDPDGNGTPVSANASDYYAAFSKHTTSDRGCQSTCNGFELMNDLDFDTNGNGTADSGDDYWNGGAGWKPVPDTTTYTGSFNGNGFALKNLFINRTTDSVGLFRAIGGGVFENIALHDVSITTTSSHVGGITGQNIGGAIIRTSYTTGSVTGSQDVGGLVGRITFGPGKTYASYSTARVHSTDGTYSNTGGLVGYIYGNSGHPELRNSYAVGLVTGNGWGGWIGGIIGNAGGPNFPRITNSYWNNEITNRGGEGTPAALGKTTAQLQSPTSYASTAGNGATAIYTVWDDLDVDGVSGNDSPWDFGTGDQYPVLVIGGHSADDQRTPAPTAVATPGAAQVTLTWKSEPRTTTNSWEYAQKTESATGWGAWTAVPSSTRATRSYTVPSLTNGTTYLFKVRAAGGYSTESAVMAATPNTGIAATDFDSDSDNLIAVSNLAQLNAVRYDLDGDGVPDSGTTTAQRKTYADAFKTSRAGFFCTDCKGYELTADLDFDTDGDGKTYTGTAHIPTGDTDDEYNNGGRGWVPIGGVYTGIFEGNGFIIDNLFVKQEVSHGNGAGLFFHIGTGGEVRNLGLRNILIRTHGNAGGIAGRNDGTIRTSFVTGKNFGYNSGLMVADNYGTIIASYAVGSVSSGGSGAIAAGIAGNRGWTANGTIKNSYAAVTASATDNRVHGITSKGTVTNSYFDKTVFGTTTDTKGKTSAQLQSPTSYTSTAGNGATAIYATWDDDDLDGDGTNDSPWDFGAADQYPVLNAYGHRPLEQRISDPVTDIGIQAASDSGDDDDITNDKTAPVIEFTQVSGATITARYRKSGAEQWTTAGITAAATGTAGTVTLPNLTDGDGRYEVEISQSDSGRQAGRGTLHIHAGQRRTDRSRHLRTIPSATGIPQNIRDGGCDGHTGAG